jgi:hypothetical protein
LFPLSIILVCLGIYLINYSFPKIDYWDEECETREKSDPISKVYQDYINFCSNFNENPNWEDLVLYQPIPTDMEMELHLPFTERLEADTIEWGIPEWPSIVRKKKLTKVADILSELALANQRAVGDFMPNRPSPDNFSLSAFVYKILLINQAREGNGLCEFFFSFAFLAPKTTQARLQYGEGVGYLSGFRWPFASPGGLMREALLSSFLFISSCGLIFLYYSFMLGLPYYTLGLVLLLLGTSGVFVIKHSIESWYRDKVWGTIPAPYPYYRRTRSHTYTIFNKFRSKPRPDLGFLAYLFYFKNI